MEPESLYRVSFASCRQDSFQAVTTAATGKVAAAYDLDLPGASGRRDLLLLERSIVVAFSNGTALYSLDGKQRWRHPKRRHSLTAVGNGLVYFENEGMGLDAVDAAGKKVLDDASFPGVTVPGTQLSLLWPRAQDFISAVDEPDPTIDEEDPNPPDVHPNISACRGRYGNRTSDWVAEYAGMVVLAPLFVPETNRWLVGVITQDDDAAYIISVELTGKAKDAKPLRFPAPFERPMVWSAGADGVVVVRGLHEGHKAAVALSLDGKTAWRWQDPEASDEWAPVQPPIRAPHGVVLLLTTRRVLAVAGGKIVWHYDLLDEAMRQGASWNKSGTLVDKAGKPLDLEVPAWGTALADGALLFSAGATLRCLDAAGKLRFAVKAPAAIVSPPVVAADGAIYVATATQLARID